MTTALLVIIGLAVPWVVHLAPPRQRLIALVAILVVLVGFAIFSSVNPILGWPLWAGLIVGIATIFGARSHGGGGRRGDDDYEEEPPAPPRRVERRPRRSFEDSSVEQTGEI